MELTQVKQVLSNPQKEIQAKLKEAIDASTRVCIHSKIVTTGTIDLSSILDMIKKILPRDKYSMFLLLLRFPIETNKIVNEIYQSLSKIFNGKNPISKIGYDTLEDILSIEDWRRKAWEVYKEDPSSIMVVDMPTVTDSEKALPYYYFVPSSSIKAIELDGDDINYLAFTNNSKETVFICDQFYRVFNETSLLKEIPHNIGYCPAKHLIRDRLNTSNEYLRDNPVMKLLNDIDWLLCNRVFKRYASLYMPFPIHWGMEQDCSYASGDTICDGGYLVNDDQHLIDYDGGLKKCPKCGDRIQGVGAFIDVPTNVEGIPTPPVGYVPSDSQAFKNISEEILSDEKAIYSSATGNYLEAINNQAVNEKQVLSLHESRKTVLENIKVNFETAEAWIIKTCVVAYSGKVIEPMINYGTDFFVSTTTEAINNYQAGKMDSIDPMILDELQDEVFALKYKNNAEKQERFRIIANIDPLRHMSFENSLTLLAQGLVKKEDVYLHLNLSSLMLKLEQKHGSVLLIGEKLDFDKRVAMIKEHIIKIAIEEMPPVIPPLPEFSNGTILNN